MGLLLSDRAAPSRSPHAFVPIPGPEAPSPSGEANRHRRIGPDQVGRSTQWFLELPGVHMLNGSWSKLIRCDMKVHLNVSNI